MTLTSQQRRQRRDAIFQYQAAHGCSVTEAIEAVAPRYRAGTALTEARPATRTPIAETAKPVTVTADQFERLLERIAPVAETRPAPQQAVPVETPTPPLHELPRETFQAVSKAYLAQQSHLRSPSWREPGEDRAPVSPFWSGYESPLYPSDAA